MSNWTNNESTLELVESIAEVEALISNEQALSDLFDEEVAQHVIDQYGEDDEVAMSQAFNNWSDSLCKGGEIHKSQYNDYCYVGKYS